MERRILGVSRQFGYAVCLWFGLGYKDFKKEYGSPIFVFLFNIQGVRNLQQKLLEVDRDVFLGVVWLV